MVTPGKEGRERKGLLQSLFQCEVNSSLLQEEESQVLQQYLRESSGAPAVPTD